MEPIIYLYRHNGRYAIAVEQYGLGGRIAVVRRFPYGDMVLVKECLTVKDAIAVATLEIPSYAVLGRARRIEPVYRRDGSIVGTTYLIADNS